MKLTPKLVSALVLFITPSFATAFGTSPLTSFVIEVAYDGTLFNGWTASSNDSSEQTVDIAKKKRGRSRRNKLRPSMKDGEIRSVEQSLKYSLAKLYGNIDPHRIVVEGCSRTDKGVHSKGSYALVYCMNDDSTHESSPIDGKRIPHPMHAHDGAFKEVPFKSDLKQLVFAMNKMLPPDVRIRNSSPMPLRKDDAEGRPFHPSLDSKGKTYRYTFSVGEIHDPIRNRDVFHVPHSHEIDISRARECAKILCGYHDFEPFRAAFRGNERGKEQNTMCTVHSIDIKEENGPSSSLCKTYQIDIEGDRFLYKQVRLMVGVIINYARTDVSIEYVKNILESKVWRESEDGLQVLPRYCAPAHGLCLRSVVYDSNFEFDWVIGKEEKVNV